MPASSGGSKISGSPAGSKPIFVRGEKHLPGNRKRTGEQGSFFWRKSVALRSRRRGGCETGRSGRLVENLADVSERIERDPAVEMERVRSEEHTSELQSPCNLVCRLLLEKKKKK